MISRYVEVWRVSPIAVSEIWILKIVNRCQQSLTAVALFLRSTTVRKC